MSLLGALVGCTLVMDGDFDKYEAASGGASGSAGTGGTGGVGGQAGFAGASGSGGCEPNLKLNEVKTAGVGAPADEFVELYNDSACAAPLDAYVLVYRSSQATFDHGVTWSAESGQVLGPGEFFVVAGNGFAGPSNAVFPNGMALGATGGGVALRMGEDGPEVDMLGWGDATNAFIEGTVAPAPGEDEAIGRQPDGDDTDDNAADFIVLSPSPGAPNPL